MLIPEPLHSLFIEAAESLETAIFRAFNVRVDRHTTARGDRRRVLNALPQGGQAQRLTAATAPIRDLPKRPQVSEMEEEFWAKFFPHVTLADALRMHALHTSRPEDVFADVSSMTEPPPAVNPNDMPTPEHLYDVCLPPNSRPLPASTLQSSNWATVPLSGMILVGAEVTGRGSTQDLASTAVNAFARRVAEQSAHLDGVFRYGNAKKLFILDEGGHLAPASNRDLQAAFERSALVYTEVATVALSDEEEWPVAKSHDLPRVCGDYMADYRAGADPFPAPILTRIAPCPFIDSEGRLHSTKGYDRDTGVYLADDADLPPLPSTEDAVRTIAELIADFPFQGPEDRSVALSALLSYPLSWTHPDQQGYLVPAHLIRGNIQASGKSLLSRLPQLLYLGQEHETFTERGLADNDEFTKELQTAAASGQEIVSGDNVTGTISSAELAKVLTTSGDYEFRQFGSNTTALRLPIPKLFMFNGNNVSIKIDLQRRFVISDLVWTRDASPHLRTDQDYVLGTENFRAYVLEHRAELLSAVLSIAQEVVGVRDGANGAGGGSSLGSFEAWHADIRIALQVITANYPEIHAPPNSPYPTGANPTDIIGADPVATQTKAVDGGTSDALRRLAIRMVDDILTLSGHNLTLEDDDIKGGTFGVRVNDQVLLERVNRHLNDLGPLIAVGKTTTQITANNFRRAFGSTSREWMANWEASFDLTTVDEPVLNTFRRIGIPFNIDFDMKGRGGSPRVVLTAHQSDTPLSDYKRLANRIDPERSGLIFSAPTTTFAVLPGENGIPHPTDEIPPPPGEAAYYCTWAEYDEWMESGGDPQSIRKLGERKPYDWFEDLMMEGSGAQFGA